MSLRRVCASCGSAWDDSATFCPKDGQKLENAKIDRYELIRAVDHHGMTSVYEARDLVSEKRVALKLISAERAANDDTAERLRREGRAASAMGDPNIVEISDFGTTPDGDVFMVMEWLDGETLRETLDRGPLSKKDALNFASQIASGLASAHSIGIVHRDVKPENIMVVAGPEGPLVKILDFGVAKVAEAEGEKLTRTGTMVGTPAYMSPEQAQGLAVDARSDVYSLGCVLYELFTGRPPFHSASVMEVVIMQVGTQPVRPAAAAPHREISRPVEDLILQCLQKEPRQRVASMMQLHRQLAAQARGSLALPLSAAGEDAELEAARTLHYHSDRLEAVVPSVSAGLPAEPAPTVEVRRPAPAQVPNRASTASVPSIDEALAASKARRWPLAVGGLALVAAGVAAALLSF